MFPTADQLWSILLNGVTDADIQSYIDDYGLTPEAPTDPKVIADLTTAKSQAAAKGSGFDKVFNQVLTYGDKLLTILSKNGIIKNQNLATAGYTYTPAVLAQDTTSSAPSTSSRVFNIDFSNPQTLIIIFLIVGILGYFLFFNNSKSKR